MNLYLFPAAPTNVGGYNIAVLADYKRLKPNENDVTVWNQDTLPNWVPRKNAHLFKPVSIKSMKAISRMMQGRFSQEFSEDELEFLKGQQFEEIFCDEVIFYRAIRKLYPEKKLTVRFHNLFFRILVRNQILKIKTDWRFEGKLRILSKLEKAIFEDENVQKVFITEEDALFYQAIMSKSDYEVWDFKPDMDLMEQNRKPIRIAHKLIWFGGLESHKTLSVKWLTEKVLPQIQTVHPDTELHLYGGGTKQFNSPARKVFGHGYYHGDGLPMRNEALYVNPDILGGGVKIKLLTYFNEGVPFISSPYGFEGYDKTLIDNTYCSVVEEANWTDYIIHYYNTYSK